jgi:4-amino-4-deoxy-L-arabinose transferase-like glycosyltransferase
MPSKRPRKPKKVRALPPPPALLRDGIAWAIIIVAGILIFASLGERCLWQDEAETAMLGRSILRVGVPVAFDGINLVSQEPGREFGADHVWRWSPWIQFYLAAASMKFFGATTFAARLPFAILGFLTLPLTYISAARAFASRAVARLSTLFLGFSVPFLLHIRQARWHAPAYLCVALLLMAILGMRTRASFTALFVVAGTLLFYTNYFVAICAIVALVAASIVLDRGRLFLKRITIGAGATALLALPGILYFQVLTRGAASGGGQTSTQLAYYMAALCTFILPLPVIVIVFFVRTQRRVIAFLLTFIELFIAALSLAPWQMFRYATTIVPAAALLMGIASAWLLERSRNLGIIVIALLLTTNVLHQLPFGYAEARGAKEADPRVFPIVAYLDEITHHLHDPECVVAAYLSAHAQPGDTVVATYGDLPVMFYTGLRTAGGLQGQPLPENPEWILVRTFAISGDPMKDGRVMNYARHHVDLTRYAEVLSVPDPMLSNAPDPAYHRYSDAADARELKLIRRIR